MADTAPEIEGVEVIANGTPNREPAIPSPTFRDEGDRPMVDSDPDPTADDSVRVGAESVIRDALHTQLLGEHPIIDMSNPVDTHQTQAQPAARHHLPHFFKNIIHALKNVVSRASHLFVGNRAAPPPFEDTAM